MKSTAFVVMLAVLFCMPLAAQADDIKPLPKVKIKPNAIEAIPTQQPPQLTSEERARRELILQQLMDSRRARMQIPVDPNAPQVETIPCPPTSLSGDMGMQRAPAAPGDFAFFRSTLMTDAFTLDQTSSTNEPTLGMNCETIFYAGNWYATVSGDGGRNFTYVDPYTTFPALAGGFCCDQIVYYDETRDLMVWYLQYSRDALGNNAIIIAVSDSNANTLGGMWTAWALTPQDLGYANGVWFDFPELSTSDNFLYWTTDIIGHPTDDALAAKISLDQLAAGGTIGLSGFLSTEPFLRPTHGAEATMYIGEHQSTSQLRIYIWPETDGLPTGYFDRNVATWYTGTYSAPSPDGTDWLNFGIPGLLGAWTGGGVVGFMWDSVQGGVFPWPYVQYARFDVSGLGLLDESMIWHPDFAYAYASVHPNDNGDIAGTIAYGGGNLVIPYPSCGAWIADDYNGDQIVPGEVYTFATGNAGPASDRWGDFFTTRRSNPYGNTWIGTGFVLNGGQGGSDVDPYFVWFGREDDTPEPPTITCPADITIDCNNGTGGTPSDDPQLDSFWSGVSATDICDPDVTITNDAPAVFPLGATVVTFTAENDIGLTNTCMATVTVQDTTPPEMTIRANRRVLWPPNHKMVFVRTFVDVTDECCEPTYRLISVTSNEPDNGKGDGNTDGDIVILGRNRFLLRSERAGGGDGRVYTIRYRARDCEDNRTNGAIRIRVPHDHSGFAFASSGFTSEGIGFDLNLDRFALVIRSTEEEWATDESGSTYLVSEPFDALTVDLSQAYVGNINGVVLPEEVREIDNNADGLMDVVLFYPARDVNLLIAGSTPTGEDEVDLDSQPGPVGLHYTDTAGVDYLVPDIFNLGTPVPIVPPIEIGRGRAPDAPDISEVKITELMPSYPNPFNPSTTIPFNLAAQENVTLRIYDARGALVRTLKDESLPAGVHTVVWDGRDMNGHQTATGVYFVRLIAGSYEMTQKIVMIK